MATYPAYCHSVAYISYICHFDIANANIRRHLRKAELWRAVGMVQQEATFRQVVVALGVHHTVSTKTWERYQLHGKPAGRHDGGRQRVSQTAQDRFLSFRHVALGFQQQPFFRNDIGNAAGIRVSTQTVRKRLHEGNLQSRIPCIRIRLTRRLRQARLGWTLEHKRWTMQHSRHVLFTDESR
jgi:hypothetical protein